MCISLYDCVHTDAPCAATSARQSDFKKVMSIKQGGAARDYQTCGTRQVHSVCTLSQD